MGKTYRVRRGTIRGSADYDDAWLLACAMRAKTVFDIGANVGQSAFLVLQNPGIENLVLVDPNPAALSQAAENIISNRLSENVRFICSFVGDRDGLEMRFWTIGTGSAGSMYAGHAKTAARKKSSIMSRTITLDSLSERLGIIPDLIKVDVEGAEAYVLEGGGNLARKQSPRFLVEMHRQPELSMEENASKVLGWCVSVGYSAWYLKDKVLLDSPARIAHRGRCHLLLQSAGERFPEWLHDIPQGASLK